MTLFLTILKITGIVLLAILGLLLLCIAIILFVPVRYHITADVRAEEDHYDIKLKVSWLLHIVRGFAGFLRAGEDKDTGEAYRPDDEQGFRYELKVLWIKLMPKDEKDDYPEESYELNQYSTFENDRSLTDDSMESTTEQSAETNTTAEPVSDHSGDNKEPDHAQTDTDEDLWQDDIPKGFRAKLKDFIKLLKSIRKRAGRAGRDAGYKFNAFCDKIHELGSNAGRFRDMIEDERNREAVKLLFDEIMRIMRAVRIRKYRVDLIYGFDDPALTGEITGLLSVLFLSLGRKVSIRPDFDRFRVDGDMYFKGRLMIITLIIVLWRLYFNKNFRRFFREIRR